MRYKNLVLDNLDQIDTLVNKVSFQLNRGMNQETIDDTLDILKENISKLKELVTLESDGFEQQFAPRN
jgi:hypothetical protein